MYVLKGRVTKTWNRFEISSNVSDMAEKFYGTTPPLLYIYWENNKRTETHAILY